MQSKPPQEQDTDLTIKVVNEKEQPAVRIRVNEAKPELPVIRPATNVPMPIIREATNVPSTPNLPIIRPSTIEVVPANRASKETKPRTLIRLGSFNVQDLLSSRISH